MLGNAKVMTTIPVVDIDRAKKFYNEKIELSIVDSTDEGIIFDAGENTQLYIYQREKSIADHTLATFLVDDVEEEVNRLKEKGVEFEEYDTPQIKTVNNIATIDGFKTAWFKDSEGNILAMTNQK